KNGFQPLDVPSDADWLRHLPAKRQGTYHFEDRAWWRIVVTPTNELWLGRCEWGYMGDGAGCFDWVYARLSPSPRVFTESAPTEAPKAALPVIAPPSDVKVTLVDDPARRGKAVDEKYAPGSPRVIQSLRCEVAGSTMV